MEWINGLRARRHVRASRYRAALEDLPDGLETGWQHSAPQEYPGIRTDAFFFARAAEGLMAFFDAAARADSNSRPCALPSEAADSVWHAWLRRDPIGLEGFCRKHFGAAVPHVERAGMGAGALANMLSAGRALEGIAPLGPSLPLVFGLDARLRMAGGHGYWSLGDDIVYARLGKRGQRLGRAQPRPELTIAALLAAGLVDASMVLAHLRRRQQMDTSVDGSFGDGALVAAFASDSACADGGGGSDGGASCDGGSSCGSSCGGSGGD